MTKLGLCVAVNDYPGDNNDLPSCVADAEAFKALLEEEWGFDEVRTLLDADATLEQVQQGLDWLFGEANEEDRRVFFWSGHGWQQPKGDRFEEVLCLHDGFLEDDELSQRTQKLPEGICTLVLDSCHSGGMAKQMFFEEGFELARSKVWTPEPDQRKELLKAIEHLEVKEFKGFLTAATTDTALLSKDFKSGSDDEAGQLQANAILHMACLENETAAASTSRTDGKSAFTWALIEVLKERGTNLSSLELHEEVKGKLSSGFRQTPVLIEPTSPQNLASKSFVTLEEVDGTAPQDGVEGAAPQDGADIDAMESLSESLRETIRNLIAKKGEHMQPVGLKSNVMLGNGAGVEGDEKGWGALAAMVAQQVGPMILEEITKNYQPASQPAAQKSAGVEGDEKFWGAVAVMVAQQVGPMILEEITKNYQPAAQPAPQKGFARAPS